MARTVHEAVHDPTCEFFGLDDFAPDSGPHIFRRGTDKPAVSLGDPVGRTVTVGIDVIEELAFQHVGTVSARDLHQGCIDLEGSQVQLGSFFVDHFENALFDRDEGHLRPLRG